MADVRAHVQLLHAAGAERSEFYIRAIKADDDGVLGAASFMVGAVRMTEIGGRYVRECAGCKSRRIEAITRRLRKAGIMTFCSLDIAAVAVSYICDFRSGFCGKVTTR